MWLLTCVFLEFPPEVVDASKGMGADAAKKKMEEAAMIIKTTYWSVISEEPMCEAAC